MQLPPGEDPSQWLKPLSLAGLAPGGPGGGAWVELRDEGSRWRLRVQDSAGLVRETTVAEPGSPQAREDVAWLAASLLKPASTSSRTLPVAPGLPPPPAPPPRPRPQPKEEVVEPVVVAPPPPPPPEPIPAAPVPPYAVPAVEEEPALVLTARPPRVRPDFALGSGVGWRPGLAPASTSWVRLGPRFDDVFLVGLEVSFTSAMAILDLGEDRTVVDGDALVGAWFIGPARTPLRAGLGGGAAYRSFTLASFQEAGVVPILGAELGLDLHVGSWLRVGPSLSLRYDLRATEVSNTGGAVTTLSPVAVRAGLSLAIGAQTGDPSVDTRTIPR